MAAPRQQGMLGEAQEVVRRAEGIARVINIPASSFAARERQAYHIMSHVSGMPAVPQHDRRHQYGNEVLQNADRLMPYSDPGNGQFFSRIQGLVITMQEFPAWYAVLTDSNDKIVNDYRLSSDVIFGMQLIGFGSAGASVYGGAVRSGVNAAAGATSGGVRAGATAFARGAAGGLGKAFTGGAAGGLAVVWVVGWFALTAIKAQHDKLGQEITRRYQNQTLSAELYQRAFGNDTALPERYFQPVR